MKGWKIAVILSLMASIQFSTGPGTAAEQTATLEQLGRQLRLDPGQISVSGVSSGGFMAHQLHVAHSDEIMGAGIITGGPYNCAQGDVNRGLTVCTAFMAEEGCKNFLFLGMPGAEAYCTTTFYQGPEPAPVGQEASEQAVAMARRSLDDTYANSAQGRIAHPQGLIGDKVILIHGSLDTLLPVGVMDAVDQYYKGIYEREHQSAPTENTLQYIKTLAAQHAVPTDNLIRLKVGSQVGDCQAFGSPYLDYCERKDCSANCCGQGGSTLCDDPANVSVPACASCNLQCSAVCIGSIDTAGAILRQIYALQNARNPSDALKVKDWDPYSPPTVVDDCRKFGTVDTRCRWLQERLFAFSQSEVFGGDPNAVIDNYMADKGYIFIPEQCRDGETVCRLHIAFHGCRQGYGFSGVDTVHPLYGGLTGWTHFIENAGYNEWADTNNIVVLYPQARPRELAFQVIENPGDPMGALRNSNPQGCWDFWGYTDQNYATKGGRQISAVWRMVEALVPGGAIRRD